MIFENTEDIEMPFCTNCGNEISESAKFCNKCGAEVNQPYKSMKKQRETIYEGVIYKCPHCGETLNSFAGVCPACGYELRGKQATDSAKKFYDDLCRKQTVAQRDSLIRNFPVPNAKEDIIEFMILSSSNILGEDENDIYEAWIAKFEQSYQKALILFGKDDDFAEIQKIYDNCMENIDMEHQRRINRFILETIIKNIIICIGIIMLVVAVIINRTGGNSSLLELLACIVLIVFAVSLSKRSASIVDYIVGGISGLLMRWIALMFDNGSIVQLCAYIVLIVVAINYFKSLNQSKK